jgi:glycosyltransferase involved in cell wall biosynthesis
MNNMNNSNRPLVSIIIVTYNSSKYVLETLESAKIQTYQNIELIVSDDGSTDKTLKIVEAWVENNKDRFNKVKIVKALENTGLPANCNRGLKVADGEWIKFIAGDDILMAHCIETMLLFSISKGSYISTSAMNEFCDDNLPLRLNKNFYLEQKRFFQKRINKQFRIYLRNPIFLNSPAFFFNKDLFKKVGNFDESFNMLEDQPMLIKALKAGYNIYYNETPTVRYRTSPKTQQRITGQQQDYFLCFDFYISPYLNKFNFFDVIVLYDYFLKIQIRKSKNKFMNYFWRILFNLTDIIYIRKKILSL